MEYPGIYPGEENTWDLEKFESVSIVVSNLSVFPVMPTTSRLQTEPPH